MKMSQAKLRELCEPLAVVNGSTDFIAFGKIRVVKASVPTGVSLGNARVVVYKDGDMIARGRFNDLSKFIIQEIRNQP
jgi:hypothetical protein